MSGCTSTTTPDAGARIGVPSGAAISTPLCGRFGLPFKIRCEPNLPEILPVTGHSNLAAKSVPIVSNSRTRAIAALSALMRFMSSIRGVTWRSGSPSIRSSLYFRIVTLIVHFIFWPLGFNAINFTLGPESRPNPIKNWPPFDTRTILPSTVTLEPAGALPIKRPPCNAFLSNKSGQARVEPVKAKKITILLRVDFIAAPRARL